MTVSCLTRGKGLINVSCYSYYYLKNHADIRLCIFVIIFDDTFKKRCLKLIVRNLDFRIRNLKEVFIFVYLNL